MTNDPNSEALLAALRRVGLVVDGAAPISVRRTPIVSSVEHKYWHVTCGCFDTMVDYRDAATHDDAIGFALTALQPWYAQQGLPDIPTVTSCKEASRNEYLEWLKRGVR